MAAPHRPPRKSDNTANSPYNEDIPTESLHNALDNLPENVRHWMEFEAALPYNPVQIHYYKRTEFMFCSWDEMLRELKRISHEDHREAFGGVHPGLDQPRAVW